MNCLLLKDNYVFFTLAVHADHIVTCVVQCDLCLTFVYIFKTKFSRISGLFYRAATKQGVKPLSQVVKTEGPAVRKLAEIVQRRNIP